MIKRHVFTEVQFTCTKDDETYLATLWEHSGEVWLQDSEGKSIVVPVALIRAIADELGDK